MNWQRRLPVVLTLVTLASVARMLAQPRFEIPLTITDGHLSWSMYFGILPGANFCIAEQDTINGHGEWEPPPVPPGPLEAWFVWPRSGSNVACFGLGSRNDYRPFTSYVQKDTCRVNVHYMSDSANLVVSWPSGLVAYFNELTLKDVQTGGALHAVNMLTTTSVSLSTADLPHFRIYASSPHNPNDTTAVQVQYRAGWNLVSNPFKIVIPGDSVRQLFPMSVSSAFGYNFGYFVSYRLAHGKGYWLKLPSETVTLRGIGYTNDTISVQGASWNLIGTAFYPVPVDSVRTIPPGIIITWFFGIGSGGYSKADTLWPGRGYCVKVSQPGLIVLPGGF